MKDDESGCEIQIKRKWSYKRNIIADHGNIDTDAFGEAPAMQPEELSEGDFRNIDEESGCDEKGEAISEELMQAKNFTSEIFHDIESAKNTMLNAVPNLERNLTAKV